MKRLNSLKWKERKGEERSGERKREREKGSEREREREGERLSTIAYTYYIYNTYMFDC